MEQAMTSRWSGIRAGDSIVGVARELVFAYDGNFRFRPEDPVWAEFFDRHAIHPVPYDDMAELTDALTASVRTVAYLPAADYFYVRRRPGYEPLASAVYAAENSTRLTSLLVVRSSSGVTELSQLRGATLGYVHRYCTTSYFAPALLCQEHGDQMAGFFAQMVAVPAYEAQIEAVLAGQVDATMVQEDVWRRHPGYAQSTTVVARKEGLPTPLLIVDATAERDLKDDLTRVALSRRPPITDETLFSGFVPFERRQVEEFFSASEAALPEAAQVT